MAVLSNFDIKLSAVKRAESSDEYILRLFDPTGKPQTTEIKISVLGIKHRENLGASEIVPLITYKRNKRLKRCNLLEGR